MNLRSIASNETQSIALSYRRVSLFLFGLLVVPRLLGAATLVGDWPFDRTADGVAVTDGQAILEESTAGLFDASGHFAMGQARHYAGKPLPGPVTAANYATWKPSRSRDGCALDTSYGGVYFSDGSPQLKASTNFSVWVRYQPMNPALTKTEIIVGRIGVWLICRDHGRLAAGFAGLHASTNGAIHDVFGGHGPWLETSKWHDIGMSIGGGKLGGARITIYLDGKLVKENEGSIVTGDAPFQIGGRGVEASFSESKAMFDRVAFYDGVLESKEFARMSRNGGPVIESRPRVVEPLQPRLLWNAGGEVGRTSTYKPLEWNPKLETFNTGGEPDAEVVGELNCQRKLFHPVLAPMRGHLGRASLVPGGTARYLIASYFVPRGYDRQSRKVTGAVHLDLGKGETARGARLDLRVYVNDELKLQQTIFAQENAGTFAAEVGRLAAGDRVDVAFGPDSLGDNGEIWFDSKVDIQSAAAVGLPATMPVAEAFRVEATKPLEEDPGWIANHYQLSALARTNRIDLIFLGDSVTAGWAWTGKAVWEKRLLQYHPGNFGISGQGTQDVLWRLSHGELDGANPSAIVLMLGSNDINWSAADIYAGVAEVLGQLRAQFPSATVILGGILPRGELPGTPERLKILEVDARLAKLADGKGVRYFSFGDKLLLPDGRMPKENAPDFLHPVEHGYELWFEAIEPILDELFPEAR